MCALTCNIISIDDLYSIQTAINKISRATVKQTIIIATMQQSKKISNKKKRKRKIVAFIKTTITIKKNKLKVIKRRNKKKLSLWNHKERKTTRTTTWQKTHKRNIILVLLNGFGCRHCITGQHGYTGVLLLLVLLSKKNIETWRPIEPNWTGPNKASKTSKKKAHKNRKAE